MLGPRRAGKNCRGRLGERIAVLEMGGGGVDLVRVLRCPWTPFGAGTWSRGRIEGGKICLPKRNKLLAG